VPPLERTFATGATMSVWHEWLRGCHSAKQGDESVALHVHRPGSEVAY
jgi:hypothetical protein